MPLPSEIAEENSTIPAHRQKIAHVRIMPQSFDGLRCGARAWTMHNGGFRSGRLARLELIARLAAEGVYAGIEE